MIDYKEQIRNSEVLCIHCCSFFDLEIEEEIICPNCYQEIDYVLYEEIYRYSYYFARYGHQYRDVYEAQSEGCITKYCLGQPDNLFTFLGMMALSGIIDLRHVCEGTSSAVILPKYGS